MKKNTFLLFALAAFFALEGQAAKFGVVSYAGPGAFCVTEQFNGDWIQGPWKLYRDGKIVPGISSNRYFTIDENGYIIVTRDSGDYSFYGMVDTAGNTVQPDEYGYILYLGNGLYALGFVHDHVSGPNFTIWNAATGTESNRISGSWPMEFSEGLCAYTGPNGKVRFLDTTGKVALKTIYKDACPFSEGMAAVRTGNKWGFINKAGKLVIPARYDHDDVWDDDDGYASLGFKDGVAVMYKNGKYGAINKRGVTIIPFTSAYMFHDPFTGEIEAVSGDGSIKRITILQVSCCEKKK